MAERERTRRTRGSYTGRVVRTEWVSPHMIRVVLGGPGLAGFDQGAYTDAYVKLLFPPRPDVTFPVPFDVDAYRAERAREDWPVMRTYTVRAWDAAAGELTIDFVYHGDAGVAGPWAAAARPGDLLHLAGPGGAYAPSTEADWHLLVGDESALPAIAAAVEQLPAGHLAHVLVEVSDAAEEQDLVAVAPAAEPRVRWLHRGDQPVGAALTEAVRALPFPPGRVHAFVHGEAGFVKDLRRLLRGEYQLERGQVSISGYWRLGRDEDGWQASKAEWNREAEVEEEAARTAAAA